MIKITLSITLLAITAWLSIISLKEINNHISQKNKSTTNDSTIFQITRDTVSVNIIGTLSRGLLINDKYYAFYEIRNPRSTQDIKKFYIINKNGKVEKEIKVHDDIKKDTYPELYFWHGRIIVNTVFYKNTYFLDIDKGEFIKNKDMVTPPLFDDGQYEFTSECHGEFRSTTYFKNKQTGVIYEIPSGCPTVVNKINNKYYVDGGEIMEIAEPLKAKEVNPFSLRRVVSYKDVKIIYKHDSLFSNFYIPTSFTNNGILYLIYNTYKLRLEPEAKKDLLWLTKDTVKIGVISASKFKPLYTFKDRFDMQLEQQISPTYQICTFHTESRQTIGFKEDKPPYREAKYGFIEIMGDKINIHYFISKKT